MTTSASRNRIGVLPGAFNPITRAHLALVDAGLQVVDEVACVVPRVYPHKEVQGADLETRVEMLRRAGNRHRVVVSEQGLFADIARELRPQHPNAELYFICGRDAAERVIHWDYGDPHAIDRILEEFRLLVASRQGELDAPPHLRHRIQPLPLAGDFDDVSSTEVRKRIAAGLPWEHLVPEPIIEIVRRVYRTS
ncbi:MAG TPA: nicotinate-nicotinamide nucleotide adenylyltransferase [Bryobacteraceae bacterium]|nr:nicotinate-nicotinamide nucleotide adenylyltransferase [Bryobacteraceae bacterium]